MKTSETVTAILEALAAAELTNPPKSARADTGSFSYTYAPLDEVLAAVRPGLRKQGVTITQAAGSVDGQPAVVTRLFHVSGEWLEAGPLVLPGGTAQAIGSAITYGRRYQLLAILGLAAEDDDGLVASRGEGAAPGVPRDGGGGEDTEVPWHELLAWFGGDEHRALVAVAKANRVTLTGKPTAQQILRALEVETG